MRGLDYFRYHPKQTIRGEEGLSSTIGAISTFVLGLLVILSIIAFGKELVLKENPFSVSSFVFEENPTVNKDDIFVAMGFGFQDSTPIWDLFSYLNFEFGIVDYDAQREKTTSKKYFPSEPCDNSPEFKNNVGGVLGILPAPSSFYHCFPYDKKSDIIGDDGSKRYVIWEMMVSLCKNSTASNIVCKPADEIKKKLEYFVGHIIIKDNLIDTRNFENPVQTTYFTTFLRLSTLRSRLEAYYLVSVNFESDEGFILENFKRRKTFTITEKFSDTIPGTSDELQVYILQVSSKKFVNKITRVYTKVQKVAADTGGIIKFFLICFQIMNMSFSKIFFIRILKEDAKKVVVDFLNHQPKNIENKEKSENDKLSIKELNINNVFDFFNGVLNLSKNDQTIENIDRNNEKTVLKMNNFMNEGNLKVLKSDNINAMNVKINKKSNLNSNKVDKSKDISKQLLINFQTNNKNAFKDENQLNSNDDDVARPMKYRSNEIKNECKTVQCLDNYQQSKSNFVEKPIENKNEEADNLPEEKRNGKVNVINKEIFSKEIISKEHDSMIFQNSFFIDYFSYYIAFSFCWMKNRKFLQKIENIHQNMFSHEEYINQKEDIKMLKLRLLDNTMIFRMYKDVNYISSMLYDEELKVNNDFVEKFQRMVSIKH